MWLESSGLINEIGKRTSLLESELPPVPLFWPRCGEDIHKVTHLRAHRRQQAMMMLQYAFSVVTSIEAIKLHPVQRKGKFQYWFKGKSALTL